MEKLLIGNLETCSLPELGIDSLQVRIDTGAKTSSLHVDNIKQVRKGGRVYIQFDLHPDIYEIDDVVTCSARLVDIRRIKSSNGDVEERFVIKTPFAIADRQWDIEITLTNRQDMSYLMLLGRQGMADHVLVDPSQAFLAVKPGEDTDVA